MPMKTIKLQPLALQQNGATLIEVLVSLVILAIGILGLFALQVSSLRSNQNAYLRTQATLLSYDIVERVRSNPAGFQSGNYNNPAAALSNDCLASAGCNAAQMAWHDVAEWQAELALKLPMGSGTVCIDSTPTDGTPAAPACDNNGTTYALKTWWDEDRDATSDQLLVVTFRQ